MTGSLNSREKTLYHQIHPAKLLTDWASTVPALYLIWQHNLVPGVVVAVVPSFLASVIIMQYVDLTKYKLSEFGRYVSFYMTGDMQVLRLAGFALMMAGAWLRAVSPILAGLGMILFAWLRGVKVSRVQILESVFLSIAIVTIAVDAVLGTEGGFHFTILDVALDIGVAALLGILSAAAVVPAHGGPLRLGTVTGVIIIGILVALAIQGGEARALLLG